MHGRGSNSRPLGSDTMLATLHRPITPKSLSWWGKCWRTPPPPSSSLTIKPRWYRRGESLFIRFQHPPYYVPVRAPLLRHVGSTSLCYASSTVWTSVCGNYAHRNNPWLGLELCWNTGDIEGVMGPFILSPTLSLLHASHGHSGHVRTQ
jgi:hypothetical protein